MPARSRSSRTRRRSTPAELIGRALVLADRAVAEAKQGDDDARIQRAARIGWNAGRLAADALFLHVTGHAPRTALGRFAGFGDLVVRDRSLAPLGRKFGSFFGYLHVWIGGGEMGDAKLVRRSVADVRRFVRRVRTLCRGSTARVR
jgi:hypothetical protein